MQRTAFPLFALLIVATLGVDCIYSLQSPCINAGCVWTAGVNATCSLPSNIPTCLTTQAYYPTWRECVFCNTLSSSNCTSICSHYFFASSNSTCTPCTNLDSNCLTCTSATVCSTCNSGFTVDTANTQFCIDSTCNISFCIQCSSSTTCQQCNTGYKVSADATQCGSSSCSVANCLNCLGSVCGTCEAAYTKSSDSLTCSLTCNDANCQSCNTADTCATCKSGFDYDAVNRICKVICLVEFCSTC